MFGGNPLLSLNNVLGAANSSKFSGIPRIRRMCVISHSGSGSLIGLDECLGRH
jgi:UDP-N-acetylglucosamine transferase subunit ALG13